MLYITLLTSNITHYWEREYQTFQKIRQEFLIYNLPQIAIFFLTDIIDPSSINIFFIKSNI